MSSSSQIITKITRSPGGPNISDIIKDRRIVFHIEKIPLTLLLPGVRPTVTPGGGGVFRTRSYFQLIWTTFWTRGTILEQLIVKGVHQWSCRGKKFEGTLKFARVIAIFLSNKISQNLEQNFEAKIFELKMAITQSILKILRSSFLQTLPFL